MRRAPPAVQPFPRMYRDVAQAADYLNVSERELFRRAFSCAFARVPNPTEVEREYADYARCGVPPRWVRDYIVGVFATRPRPGVCRLAIDGLSELYESWALGRLLLVKPRPRMPRTDLVT